MVVVVVLCVYVCGGGEERRGVCVWLVRVGTGDFDQNMGFLKIQKFTETCPRRTISGRIRPIRQQKSVFFLTHGF